MGINTVASIQYAHEHRDYFLNKLTDILSIPSVSTTAEHKPDMVKTAEWLVAHLKSIGMQSASIFSTDRHPVVFSEYKSGYPTAKTILIYGHYDVQPVEPLNLWESDPFTATLRADNLFARGASDMKGQVMASIHTVESLLALGDPGVNIKFLIEGEEEIGSPNLEKFMADHIDMLTCDAILNPDAGMLSPELPAITYGLRGLAFFEMRVYGPERDLHSGSYGGVVHNPAQALCELIAGMHDKDGRVTLPGFYDSVLPLSQEERAEFARLPMQESDYLKQTGSPKLWGEKGFSPAERQSARPTLEVNGMSSGFFGEGGKTIIPAYAMAKISMRLVPDQNPDEVHKQLLSYLEANAPETIRWEVIPMSGGPASLSDRNQPASKALSDALYTVWNIKPIFVRMGGSIPVVSSMQKVLKKDSVITGFGLPDDHIHSPNEKLHLPTWYRGIDAMIYFFKNFAEN